MVDTGAERARRARQHGKGDHSLCKIGRCAEITPKAEAAAREPGRVELATRAYVGALPYRGDDPRVLIGELAVALATRIDTTNALPAAVKELRLLLRDLAELPNGPAGPVDEVRLDSALRMMDAIIDAQLASQTAPA